MTPGTPLGTLLSTPLDIRGARAARRLAALALLAGGVPARGQAPSRPADPPAYAEAYAEAYAAALAALPRDVRDELTATVDSARAAGLPAGPLQGKVVEGVAKGADPAQIRAVVRNVAAGLRAARAALSGVSEPELVAGGAAVQAGVPAELLRRLRASVPRTRPATQSVVVLTDLVRRGVPPADGAAALARLVRGGADDGALSQLRAEVAADVTAGLGARAAVARRTDALLSARPRGRAPIVTPLPTPLDP